MRCAHPTAQYGHTPSTATASRIRECLATDVGLSGCSCWRWWSWKNGWWGLWFCASTISDRLLQGAKYVLGCRKIHTKTVPVIALNTSTPTAQPTLQAHIDSAG